MELLSRIKTPRDLNEVHADFWASKMTFFNARVAKRPEQLQAAIAADRTTSLVTAMENTAPIHEKGTQARAEDYIPARVFVRWLHERAWQLDPTQYKSNVDFAEHTSQRISTISDLRVAPATIRQWLKEFGLRNPRLAKPS